MVKNQMCQGGALLNLLKQFRTWTEKKEFLEQAIVDCSPKQKKCPSKSNGVKRQMNGWSCALKKCSKDNNGMKMPDCMQSSVVKQDYYDNKEQYTQMAKEGCN